MNAPGGAFLRADNSCRGKRADDLQEVVARDRELPSDLLGGEVPPRLSGQPHQGPESIVGKGGETHGHIPIRLGQSHYGMVIGYFKYLLERPMSANERRAEIVAEISARTGIDEAMIERLVRSFYEKVRKDPLLGPVFDERISDWEPHLQRMCAFWSSVALMSGRYHGRPMEKHTVLPVDARHFDQWLQLFERTAYEVCPEAAARHFVERAHRIAESLELGIAMENGVLLTKGQRLHRPDADVRLPAHLEAERSR